MKGLLDWLSPAASPQRLAETGSDAERRLLAAAARDGAPSAAAARMASALGAVLVDSPEAAAPTPGSSPRLLGNLGLKPVVGLALLGGGIAGLWLWLQQPSAPVRAVAPPATEVEPRSPIAALPLPAVVEGAPSLFSSEPQHGGSEPQPQGGSEPQPQSGTPSTSSVGLAPPPAAPQRRRGPRASQLRASAAPAEGTLAEEVRTLDAIRGALNAGDAARAERELERYGRRFPEGELRLESELLAVDLALAQGQPAQARTRARELLARPGSGRYAEHLQRALDGSNTGGAHIVERR